MYSIKIFETSNANNLIISEIIYLPSNLYVYKIRYLTIAVYAQYTFFSRNELVNVC